MLKRKFLMLCVGVLVLGSLHFIKDYTVLQNDDQQKFLDRRTLIQEYCSHSSLAGKLNNFSNPSLLSRFIVDDAHNLIYCFVPKVACTNWKRVLLAMQPNSNYTDPLKIVADRVHRSYSFKFLHQLPTNEIKMKLKNYRKFFFVRHPIERLVSAFRNKFEKKFNSSLLFQSIYGPKIMKRYRTNGTISSEGADVTFKEFVQYVIDTFHENPWSMENHWAPASQLCLPCDIQYDYVGKYETIEEDAKYILNVIDETHRIQFPPYIPTKTRSLVHSYVMKLSKLQRIQLGEVYANDFEMFGYMYELHSL